MSQRYTHNHNCLRLLIPCFFSSVLITLREVVLGVAKRDLESPFDANARSLLQSECRSLGVEKMMSQTNLTRSVLHAVCVSLSLFLLLFLRA